MTQIHRHLLFTVSKNKYSRYSLLYITLIRQTELSYVGYILKYLSLFRGSELNSYFRYTQCYLMDMVKQMLAPEFNEMPDVTDLQGSVRVCNLSQTFWD